MSERRFGFSRSFVASALGVACAAPVLLSGADARAQTAGTTNAPLPNVLLLVDTSGSMERMIDDSLPTCNPGTQTTPNRWGTMLQALTGSFQPYYSCDAVSRSSTRFKNEYSIDGNAPYDQNYDLPYHRPLTGGSAATACANMPYSLPGGGAGVGGANRSTPSTQPNDFPPDAIESLLNTYVQGANGNLTATAANTCHFSQALDGQLDAVQDYVRFSLMTFDPDTRSGRGVTSDPYSASFGTSHLTGAAPATQPPYAEPFNGLWSYYRSTSNPLHGGTGVATGFPAGCGTASDFEVGARHWSAPPWEGRHVPFANPFGSLLDIETKNDQIQRVLLGTRPWGATPIAGQLDDARDYLWYNDYGPFGNQAGYADPYVKKGCRQQYIIVLTDGAPNLDLRPSCSGTGCPYQQSWQIADDLYQDKINGVAASRGSVQTFVIGFSVNGTNRTPNDGFPTTGLAAYTAPMSCTKWYANTGANGGNSSPITMDSVCSSLASTNQLPKGSTAEACCELNKIALYGSGGPTAGANALGAFFADSGVDIVTAFSRILGGIAKSATTRTSPGAAPSMSLASAGGNETVSATYVASFIPNARKVWSGEVDRSRVKCAANSATPTAVPQKDSEGDFYSVDTAAQAIADTRRFFTVVADGTGATKSTVYPATGTSSSQPIIDSMNTIRPFVPATGAYGADGAQAYSGTEVFGDRASFLSVANFPSALNIDNTTCKRSQYVTANTAYTVPPLDYSNCAEAIWDFATAFAAPLNKTVGANTFDFNLRCKSTGGLAAATTGTCSISGQSCSLDLPTCPKPGEACVPYCSALGAVFRSTPTVAGPPSGFLRDEGFRGFQALRSTRRPILYVATTDGLLHAFKALYDDPSNLSPTTANYELWSFIPPAVLPRLASNYPGGQQILLDGSPVVKDTVWYRTGSSQQGSDNLNDWHTTLVASLGAGGAGYYALNVSDADCGGLGNPNACNSSFVAATPGAPNILSASAGATSTGGRQPGPHFMWQLTDIEESPADVNAKVSRSNVPYSAGSKNFRALFGRQTGTPVITTLDMLDSSSKPVQVGVAILPGGIDGPPTPGLSCPRAINGGVFGTGYRVDNTDSGALASPPVAATTDVRAWGPNCNSPVPGRGVTIVRLDTGEIIRHFGRKTQDVPARIWSYTIDSPFDSPMIGTPVVYPASLGSSAQKVFIGDADGTLWRIDLSERCSLDPTVACSWKAVLFTDVPAQTGTATTAKQPIAVRPVVSQSPTGSLVVNVATGDQENLIASSDVNYVMSLEETRPAGAARLKWYVALPGGERVTGPMAVFDRTLYFATYVPANPTLDCAASASAYLWGLDYYSSQTPGTPSSGGAHRWCPNASTSSSTSALCAVAYTDKEAGSAFTPPITGMVPGVAVTPSLACTSTGALSEDYGQGITGMTPTTYSINFNWSAKGGTPSGSQGAFTARGARRAATPRYNATLDAWSFVTD